MATEDVNSFERFSLRAARTLLVGSIVFGCAAIGIGLLVSGGAWLMPGPVKSPPEPAPTPAKFTLDDAEKWAHGHAADLREFEDSALALSDPGVLPSTVAPLFPEPPYVTADVWEDYCRSQTEYGCLQRGKRIKQPSVARTFTVLFRNVEVKRREELMGVLVTHLPNVPTEKRLTMVAPVLMAYVQVGRQNAQAASEHQDRVAQAEAIFESEKTAHGAKILAYSLGGLTAAGWGLGWVISASIFVALLAIERHLRELRRVRPTG